MSSYNGYRNDYDYQPGDPEYEEGEIIYPYTEYEYEPPLDDPWYETRKGEGESEENHPSKEVGYRDEEQLDDYEEDSIVEQGNYGDDDESEDSPIPSRSSSRTSDRPLSIASLDDDQEDDRYDKDGDEEDDNDDD